MPFALGVSAGMLDAVIRDADVDVDVAALGETSVVPSGVGVDTGVVAGTAVVSSGAYVNMGTWPGVSLAVVLSVASPEGVGLTWSLDWMENL